MRGAIRIEHLSSDYGKDMKILKDVSFTVGEGNSTAILGANGCGKTTLFRCLTGLLPFTGKVEIFGKDIRQLKRDEIARRIALLPQTSGVYFSYTVKECVELGRFVRGVRTSHDREVIDRAMELCGLSDLAQHPVDALSGGQLQRVFLARTIAQEAPVILLDEPTNHLDLRYQNELMEYLKEWEKGQTCLPDGSTCRNTLIGSYHDIGLAAQVSRDVVLMKDGRVLSAGKKEQVLSRERLTDAFDFDVTKALRERQEVLESCLSHS